MGLFNFKKKPGPQVGSEQQEKETVVPRTMQSIILERIERERIRIKRLADDFKVEKDDFGTGPADKFLDDLADIVKESDPNNWKSTKKMVEIYNKRVGTAELILNLERPLYISEHQQELLAQAHEIYDKYKEAKEIIDYLVERSFNLDGPKLSSEEEQVLREKRLERDAAKELFLKLQKSYPELKRYFDAVATPRMDEKNLFFSSADHTAYQKELKEREYKEYMKKQQW